MLVTCGTVTDIAICSLRHRGPVHLLKPVSYPLCLVSPDLAVPRFLAGQCVGDFVQQDLLDFINWQVLDKVFADRDSAIAEIALTRSAHRSVETKGVVDQPVLLEKPVSQIDYLGAHAKNTSAKAVSF